MGLPFSILRPVQTWEAWMPEVDPAHVLVSAPPSLVVGILQQLRGLRSGDVMTLDVETQGTDTWNPNTRIVGIGVAWSRAGEVDARYFDLPSLPPARRGYLVSELCALSHQLAERGVHVVNHNIMFDVALMALEDSRATGSKFTAGSFRYTHCTYGLYKQLAGEGWNGQLWGLKPAQMDLLRWQEKGSNELDDWLIAHGYHRGGPRFASPKFADESPAQHMQRVQEWIAKDPQKRKRKVTAKKADMWRAPAAVLGRYCILDCISTLQLYTSVIRPKLDQFPGLEEFHCGPWLGEAYALADQQYTGIRLLKQKLQDYANESYAHLVTLEARMLACPVIGRRVRQLNAAKHQLEVEALAAKEPVKFKTMKVLKPPVKHTKKGAVSAAWIKYESKMQRVPEVARGYTTWAAKMAALHERGGPAKPFSFGSNADVVRLLFGGDAPLIRTEPGIDPEETEGRGTFFLHGRNGRVEIELTRGGSLAVGADALAQLPEWGEPLAEYRELAKEMTYVESYLALAWFHRSADGTQTHDGYQGEWRLHPGWIMAGTKTMRLSGARPNFQQIPKSLRLLECFVPDTDTVWMEMDWTAVEPHVLCELSGDAGLMALYGPDALPHDRYLFSVSKYPGALGDAVRRVYPTDADPDFAAKVKAAKKACSELERPVGKKMVLSGDYGAGWRKQFRGLQAEGIRVTEAQVQEMNEAHKDLHQGVYRVFGPALEAEWRRRGGYVLSGMGHPVCIYEDAIKDCVNRVVQRTAHDIHVMYIDEMSRRLYDAGIQHVGIVWDFHDQFIIQLSPADSARALTIATETVQWINQELGATIPLKGVPRLVTNLADAKVEEKWAAHLAAQAAS